VTDYTIIRIYTSEKARFEGKELAQSIESYIRSLKLAARCVVMRGISGCYENGESASAYIVELSYNLPLIIEIILPQVDATKVLEHLDAIVVDGIVAVVSATVSSHRTMASLVPKNLRVRDVMTPNPVCAHADFSVRAAAEILLDSTFKALPVIDAERHCLGIITPNDLVSHAGMPARLGLIPLIPERERERWLLSCEKLHCQQVMTKSPKVIKEDARLVDAIKLMNRESLKRLPVLDAHGVLVGILSRIDILRTIAMTHESIAPSTADATGVHYPRYVEELTDRDTFSLPESTGLKSAIDTLVAAGSQRAAVVDTAGHLVGIITDEILVRALGGQVGGKFLFGLRRKARQAARPIANIMVRNLKVATEKMNIYEALGLMTEYGLKRIPVVDANKVFKGMIRRDSILLAFSQLWDSSESSE
jgi:CBS-domain-containing membrane protein